MVDREQGRGQRGERSVAEVGGATSPLIAQPEGQGAEERQAARRARFLLALVQAMADHHAVLAVLAK